MVKIPTRLDELIPAAALEKVMQVLNQPDIPSSVREALSKVGWKDANPLGQVQDAWQQARTWLDSISGHAGKQGTNPTLLNATGALLHADFDAVPMSSAVAFGFAKSATTFQCRQTLQARAKSTAETAFGHPTAWLASSQIALQLLQLERVAPGGIVISRADAVRVPGFGDVRGLLTTIHGRLTEVGAANGATASDWSSALHSSQQVVLLVSPDSLSVEAAAAQREAAVKAAKQVGARVVELLIDGVLGDTLSQEFGFAHVKARLASGTHAVLLPLQFLLSGPPGILATGEEKFVRAMTEAAQPMQGLMSGAQLSAAMIAVQSANLSDELEGGVASQLLANADNLKNRARRLAIQLNDTPRIREAVEVERECALGPTPWDRFRLKNWAVRVTPRDSLEQLRSDLIQGDAMPGDSSASGATLPIATAATATELYFDLRFVAPEDDHEIVIAATSGEV
jgi:hypothetical protein